MSPRFCRQRDRVTGIIAALAIITSSHVARAGSLAESAYQLLHDQCPKTETIPKPIETGRPLSNPNCTLAKTPTGRLEALRADVGAVSEGAYLASLAELRGDALECEQLRLKAMATDTKEFDAYIDDTAQKLNLYANEMAKIKGYQNERGLMTPAQMKVQPPKELALAVARSEAILASISHTENSAIRGVVKLMVAQPGVIAQPVAAFRELLAVQMKAALPVALSQVTKEATAMKKAVETMGASLDDSSRESLAQDFDLVEQFRNENSEAEAGLKTIACRVDAKFGRGAQIRDNALLGASVLLTGGASLVTRIGGSALAAQLTGRAALGALPLRSAQILRFGSMAGMTAVTVKEAEKQCFGPSLGAVRGAQPKGIRSDSTTNRCKASGIKSLGNDNCILWSTLSALGFVGTTVAAKEIFAGLTDAKTSRAALAGVGVAERGAAPEVATSSAADLPNASAKASMRSGAQRLFDRIFSGRTSYAPIEQQDLKFLDVQKADQKVRQKLKTMGVRVSSSKDPTYMDGKISNESVRIEGYSGKGQVGSLLIVDELPPAGRAGPNALALTHPEMPKYLEKMRAAGNRLAVDTSIEDSATGAYHWVHTKVIGLRPNSPWSDFIHEFEHLEFAEKIRPHFPRMVEQRLGGQELAKSLPENVALDIGPERLKTIESLIDKGIRDELAVNETLAINQEQKSLGIRAKFGRNVSSEQYKLRHQITGMERYDSLTDSEKALVEQLKRKHGMLELYKISSEPAFVGTLGVGGSAVGGVAVYLKKNAAEFAKVYSYDGSFSSADGSRYVQRKDNLRWDCYQCTAQIPNARGFTTVVNDEWGRKIGTTEDGRRLILGFYIKNWEKGPAGEQIAVKLDGTRIAVPDPVINEGR